MFHLRSPDVDNATKTLSGWSSQHYCNARVDDSSAIIITRGIDEVFSVAFETTF
jgi:hypothetical protein